MPNLLNRKPALSLFTLAAIVGLSAFPAMHMRLVKSYPEKDQVLTEAPRHIQLWFSQNPEVAVTRVRLMGADETKFTVTKAAATEDAKSVMLTITDTIPEGTYTIAWQTAAPDGHKVKGEYAFTYSAGESEGDSGY